MSRKLDADGEAVATYLRRSDPATDRTLFLPARQKNRFKFLLGNDLETETSKGLGSPG